MVDPFLGYYTKKQVQNIILDKFEEVNHTIQAKSHIAAAAGRQNIASWVNV